MEITKLVLNISKNIESMDADDYESIKEDLISQLEEQGFDINIVSEEEGLNEEDYFNDDDWFSRTENRWFIWI